MTTYSKWAVLAFVSGCGLLAANPAFCANTTATVGVRFDLAALRNGSPITTNSYGSGFIYENSYITNVFEDSNWANTYADFGKVLAQNPSDASASRGVIRFPNGDFSQTFFWNDYQTSSDHQGLPHSSWLSAEKVINYFKPQAGTSVPPTRTPINSDIIFQVNAFSMAGDGTSCYVAYTAKTVKVTDPQSQFYGCPTGAAIRAANGAYEFNDASKSGLQKVAQSAADWYRKAVVGVPLSRQPDYWEIGNEDWNFWKPDQYAEIVTQIGNKLIEAYNGVPSSQSKKPLRLLIQSNIKTVTVTVGGTAVSLNDSSWLTDVGTGLKNRNFSKGYIYGVSEHRYVSGDVSKPIATRAQDVFSIIDNQEVTELNALNAKLSDVQSKLQLSAPWKLWVTEYNLFEHFPNTASYDANTMHQTQAHALVFADWTGRMLAKGVERVLPLSVDYHPAFALFNYDNNGGTGLNPIMMPGGTIMSKMASNFIGTMYQTDVSGNANLKAYATYEPGNKTLHLMLVNRDPANACDVSLKSVAKRMASSLFTKISGTYAKLRSNPMATSNLPQKAGNVWQPYPYPYSASNPPVNWLTDESLSAYQKTDTSYVPGQYAYYLAKGSLDATTVPITVPAASVLMYSMQLID